MGFVLLLVVAAVAAAGLWRWGGIARTAWPMIGAALMLGAAGYAWQGQPFVPGQPLAAQERGIAVSPEIVELRGAMLGRYGLSAQWFTVADAMTRAGATGTAVVAIQSGIRIQPDNYGLWTGLGTAITNHDGGNVSPTALFAFQHATRLAPRSPVPPFFEGLAYVSSGQLDQTRRLWRRALALTPPGASYRAEIAGRLALLEQLMAMQKQAPAAPQ